VRERLGLRTGDEIEFVEDHAGYHLRKCMTESPFHKWRGHLQHLAGHTTDDLMDELRAE
jgi:bifunctional DNA-binding transcriptional regulator/antitoxin component of YhaV-PrlF toxin-antitoxin module